MPIRLRLIALCAVFALSLSLAACGGADSGTPIEAAQAEPVILASFGSNAPCSFGLAQGLTNVTIYNYSLATITEAGIRPTGTTNWTLLSASNPTNFGNPNNGGSFLAALPVGNYEVYLETSEGRLDFAGSVPCVTVPVGGIDPFTGGPLLEARAGPADIYLFSFDEANPNPGGGTPTPPTPPGPTPGGGGGGILGQ